MDHRVEVDFKHCFVLTCLKQIDYAVEAEARSAFDQNQLAVKSPGDTEARNEAVSGKNWAEGPK